MPYNPFTIGGVTPEALNYLQVPGLQQGKIEQEIYSASITGDLGAYGIKSPFAQESIKVAFGVEKRIDRLKNVTDDPTSQFLLSGRRRSDDRTVGLDQGDSTCSPSCAFRWCRTSRSRISSALELAYRYSDYDPITTDTYKVGADWAPVQDVRFRASYQRAVRAPNVVELFTAQGFESVRPAGRSVRRCNLAGTRGRSFARGVYRERRAGGGVRRPGSPRRVWTARPASTTSCRAATRT